MEELFLEILDRLQSAEEAVINDRGCTDDYDILESDINEYKDRFYKLLNNNK